MIKNILLLLRRVASFLLTVFVFALCIVILVIFMAVVDVLDQTYLQPWMDQLLR